MACGITSDPSSLYEASNTIGQDGRLYREKKKMPTIGSWYKRLQRKAQENTNEDYRFHYSYLLKVDRKSVV